LAQLVLGHCISEKYQVVLLLGGAAQLLLWLTSASSEHACQPLTFGSHRLAVEGADDVLMGGHLHMRL
jgi:hypothetical protein